MKDMKHVYIDYEVYQELKNNKYKLTQGISQFNSENLDQGVMFFDKDDNFIDQDRLKIENIKVEKVLIPRFLLLENMEKLESFLAIDKEGNKITFVDLFKNEEENIKKYGLTSEQEERINNILKEF